MIIKFSQEFLKYTNFQESIELTGSTVGQVLSNLFNDYPQLYVFLVDKEGEEATKTSFNFNGEYVFEATVLYNSVGAEDTLEFGRDIPTGSNSTFKIIAGVALIALTAWNPGGFITAAYLPAMYGMGISMALGGVAELIIGQPSLPTGDNGNNTSATYTFSGIKNTTVLGTPLSIVYGQHRVGGHILNVYNDVVGTDTVGNSSWLRMQIGLCEGEINDVDKSSIEINGRSLLAFPASDIDAIVRYGTSEQPAPPSKFIAANDATDERTLPSGTSYITTSGWEYTLLSPASSVDIYVNSSVGHSLHQNTFKIFYKLASSTEDYVEFSGPYKQMLVVYDAQSKDMHRYPITFKVPGVYKLKVVELSAGVGGYFYKGAQDTETYPGALYVAKYVTHNSADTNYDTAAVMEHFNKVENSTAYSLLINNDPDGVVDPTSPGVIATTTTSVDNLKVNLSAPAMYNSTDKGLEYASVDIKIYWKLSGFLPDGTTPKDTYAELYPNGKPKFVLATISGKGKSEIELSKELPITESGIYDIKAVRVTPSNESNIRITDRVYLKDVVEIVQEQLIYPHTALLGLSIKATTYISGGLPNVTSIVQGTKVLVPENYNPTRRYMSGGFTGTFQADKQWTDNPVWCLYDLITNDRYGLKSYFKISNSKLGLMKANFFLMSQYCDQRITANGTVISDPNTAGYDQARPRFSLNIVLDQSKSAMEWLTVICATIRATLYYSEGLVYIDIDRPKQVTQIFNMSNIKEFSESGTSVKQLPNVYEVQFNNASKDYDQDTILIEDPAFQADLSLEEYKKTLQLMGITGEDQAKALAKYSLRIGQLLTTTVAFKTSTYGLLSTVGDVVGVQHDVPQWGYGGNVKSYNQGTKVITLSDTVEIKTGVSYSIQLVHKGKVPETVDIVEPAPGRHTQLALISAPTDIPAKGDYYYVGETTNLVKPFKIVALKRDKDEVIEVTCVEYNAQIYADADNITDLPVISMPQYSQLEVSKKSVKNVLAESNVYVASNGSIKTGATVYYSVPIGDISWNGVIVYYGIGGNYKQMPIDKTGTVVIPEITEDGDYQFLCISTYTDGTRQTVEEVLADTDNSPFYNLRIAVYNSPTELGGVFLIDEPTSTEFIGKDAKIAWRSIPYLEDGVTPLGLEHYQIQINNTDGSTRRTSTASKEVYTYTFDMNVADGLPAARTFDAVITAYDTLGRPSNPISIRISNVAPAALS